MSDEIPVVTIGGLHRIAFDRRPPASRQSQKAEGVYGEEIVFEQRRERPMVFSTPKEPRHRELVSSQPFHQRVRIHWREFLGV